MSDDGMMLMHGSFAKRCVVPFPILQEGGRWGRIPLHNTPNEACQELAAGWALPDPFGNGRKATARTGVSVELSTAPLCALVLLGG